MSFNISRGKIQSALKVCLYGPEGIGKTTFASQFPDPVFIDTEGSTKHLDVMRTDPPSSWTMLLQQIKHIKDLKPGRTLVIDTIDWAERMARDHVIATLNVASIESIGYGRGYVYAAEEWGRMLNLLEEVIESGMHVVLLAHAHMRKFEQPDEMGAYDRWEMKLDKRIGPMTKEWADMVLFANYKTTIITDSKTNSKKAVGGERVMYTTHHPAWDAKNRQALPEELKLGFEPISHLFNIPEQVKQQPKPETKPEPKPEPVKEEPKTENTPERFPEVKEDHPFIDPSIPKELADLMKANDISEEELSEAAYLMGYQPEGMKIKDMPQDFVLGWYVAHWDKVYQFMLDKGIIVPF